MFCGFLPVILVFLSFLCACSRGETTIFCDLKQTCILPCRFQPGDEEVIHWIQENAVAAPAHSYYYKKDQLTLQDQRFKGRTSLFLDRLSSGNASLLLTEVEVPDEGRYKCYTSTTLGHDQSFVQLKVDAPVRKVDVDRAGTRVTCSSEGIYPKPELTWSTEPPSDASVQDNTSVQPSGQQLYSITSSINLPGKDFNVSCSVQTRKNKKKTTLFKPSNQVTENEANLSCTLPATNPANLVWRFNQSQEILSQDSDKEPVVSDRWKIHFVNLLKSGSLKLRGLTSNEGGIYTCEASNSEETLRSDTHLTIQEKQETAPRSNAGIIAGVVVVIVVGAVIVGIAVAFFIRRKSKRNNNVL